MKKQHKYKLGELFCGPGGLGKGATDAKVVVGNTTYGVEHAWATDYDEDACNTYRRNLASGAPDSVICSDIRKLDMSRLQAISEVDALAFGFPCNDFSLVGEQKGVDGTFGPLYKYCVKAVEFFRPKWFLAENVGGLRSSNEGRTFDLILENLEAAGYRLYPHLYHFERYGVPQARHRVIIVGIRNDIDKVFHVPSTEPFRSADISCRTAIEIPPIPKDAPNNEATKQSESVVNRLRHIRPGQNAFNADIPKNLQLNVRGARISQIYKRLDPTKPAYTITGSGGGGTHVYHWSENRALTNRERARLQTFPDDYLFTGSKEKVRKQIGMAVPPRGVKIIVEALLKSLASVGYSSEYQNIIQSERLCEEPTHYIISKGK